MDVQKYHITKPDNSVPPDIEYRPDPPELELGCEEEYDRMDLGIKVTYELWQVRDLDNKEHFYYYSPSLTEVKEELNKRNDPSKWQIVKETIIRTRIEI